MVKLVICAIAVVAVLMAGCGGDDDDDSGSTSETAESREAQADLCEEMDDLQGDITAWQELDEDAPSEDVERIQDDFLESLEAIIEDVNTVADAAGTALEQALASLRAIFEDVQAGEFTEAARQAAQAAVETVEGVVDEAQEQVDCE
jgi:hypothetical protein